jgi:hypothetical protein
MLMSYGRLQLFSTRTPYTDAFNLELGDYFIYTDRWGKIYKLIAKNDKENDVPFVIELLKDGDE